MFNVMSVSRIAEQAGVDPSVVKQAIASQKLLAVPLMIDDEMHLHTHDANQLVANLAQNAT
jgi:hypothetical protein